MKKNSCYFTFMGCLFCSKEDAVGEMSSSGFVVVITK
jgi:hypothetical protein